MKSKISVILDKFNQTAKSIEANENELKTIKIDNSRNFGKNFTVGFGKSIILPDDIESKKYYIAGYSENNPAKGVIDPQYAHAMYINDNTQNGKYLLISVDAVGLLRSDINEIKAKIRHITASVCCNYVFIFCTHNHAGIDTMGIWGPLPKSGKDKKFMQILYSAVEDAVKQAINNTRDGKIMYGTVRVPDMQEDIRTPVVYSDILTRLRFIPDDGSNEIWFLNFASHSESLQGCNHLVSADFPCYLRERIKQQAGADTVYSVGAIGGMISMQIDDETTLRKEHRLLESTRNIGYKLADYALSISNDTELKPSVSFAMKEFYCPVENPVLSAACRINLLNAQPYHSKYNKSSKSLKSEVSILKIDNIKLIMLPAEIFPELIYGGYLTADESAEGKDISINPVPLSESIEDDKYFIIGLANDELGYVIPPNDFMLNAEKPYLDKAIDRFGRRHYEETNSMGPKTAEYILNAVRKLL